MDAGAVRVLGWGSVGLAVVGTAAPRRLGRALGYGERPGLVLALAARDLVVGVGLLASARPRPWVVARLASEVADTVLHVGAAATGAFDRRKAIAIGAGAAAIAAAEWLLLSRQQASLSGAAGSRGSRNDRAPARADRRR